MPFMALNDDNKSIIKVIGVGGGGGNAVSHMYREGIEGVTFALCNTDNQALRNSPIPVKLQLGPSITQGLGAGNDPKKAQQAAEESIEDIRKLLNDGTQMVFITAGMGGGTGTGASPVVARVAKEMGILTIGIVTIPFVFEGRPKILQALDGVDAIRENVDALMIVNNERLRSIYAGQKLLDSFAMADDTLTVAARSIVEIIGENGSINIDFADVKKTLQDGGVAIISTGLGEGVNRVEEAIKNALHSPLLNNTQIVNSKRILLALSFDPEGDFMTDEMDGIHAFMKTINPNVEVIWGYSPNKALGKQVKITLLASGFDVKDFTDEEINQEIEEEKTKRIEKAYPGMFDTGNESKKRHLYIFKSDTLDDDDIIANVEDSPTYQRDRSTLNRISVKPETVKPNPVQTPADDDGIQF